MRVNLTLSRVSTAFIMQNYAYLRCITGKQLHAGERSRASLRAIGRNKRTSGPFAAAHAILESCRKLSLARVRGHASRKPQASPHSLRVPAHLRAARDGAEPAAAAFWRRRGRVETMRAKKCLSAQIRAGLLVYRADKVRHATVRHKASQLCSIWQSTRGRSPKAGANSVLGLPSGKAVSAGEPRLGVKPSQLAHRRRAAREEKRVRRARSYRRPACVMHDNHNYALNGGICRIAPRRG